MQKTGFTLVELAIVLVIIGLITGGVLGAQSLIQSAKINSVISDVSKYKAAYLAFQLEYDAIPGDMVDAYEYWGNDCNSTESRCNGNGNKLVSLSGGSPIEPKNAWWHMKLAEIIEDNVKSHYSESDQIPGVSVPEFPIEASVLLQSGTQVNGAFYIIEELNNINYLKVAGYRQDFRIYAAGISPTNAKRLDKKLDDYQPTTGSMITSDGNSMATGTDCVNSSEEYVISDLITCVTRFKLNN